MKHLKRSKYASIISWSLFVVALIAFYSIDGYFYQQGYRTDEDWFESGLSFTVWGNISILAEWIVLLSFPSAVISSILYIVLFFTKKRRDNSQN